MDLSKLDVYPTSGNVFRGEDSARLALLIFRRFGANSAWSAWLRLMENNCSKEQYLKLVRAGEILALLDNHVTYDSPLETQELLKELDNL